MADLITRGFEQQGSPRKSSWGGMDLIAIKGNVWGATSAQVYLAAVAMGLIRGDLTKGGAFANVLSETYSENSSDPARPDRIAALITITGKTDEYTEATLLNVANELTRHSLGETATSNG